MNKIQNSPIIIPVLLRLIYVILTELNLVSSYILPDVEKILLQLKVNLFLGRNHILNLVYSISTITVSILISAIIALSINILQFLYPKFKIITLKNITVASIVPITALIPTIILICGIGAGSKYATIILSSFFTIFFSIHTGFNNIPKEYLDLLKIYPQDTHSTTVNILLPLGFIWIILGLRSAFFNSWNILLLVEIIGSNSGLGYLLWDARNFGRSDEIFAILILICATGTIINNLLKKVEVKFKHLTL